ncbi:MAG: ribosome small subunit-dependent GTPase A [Deferrisomatales bacterium]|nr:ribosome small subunit-dependent GTPase A [Deferrisomatales bacterium]
MAHHGVAVEVLFGDGVRRSVRVKRRSGHVVGDRIVVRDDTLERLPRTTELRRRDGRGRVHLVGANLDVVAVVVAPQPAPTPGFIDRAIVAARAAELRPFVIVNKGDLDGASRLAGELHSTYAPAGVPVFLASAARGEGLDALAAFFAQGHCGAFVGTSGVGKSTLLNALCAADHVRVGELNERTGLGLHTTTVATLHHLPGGGVLVDTPGFRDFGVVDLAAADLAGRFPGFEAAAGATCRFRDCTHSVEPGCALLALAEGGEISGERWQAYREFASELEAAARQRG